MTDLELEVAKQIFISVCSEAEALSNFTEEQRREMFSSVAKFCREAAEEFHKECSE